MSNTALHRSGRAALALATILVLAIAISVIIWLTTRQRSIESRAAAVDPQVQLARENAAKFFYLDEQGRAKQALEPLVARPDAATQDLVAIAVTEMTMGDPDNAKKHLDQALKSEPESPAVHFNLARLAEDGGDPKTAEQEARRTLQLAPDDVPTQLLLARQIEDEHGAEALALYRAIQSRGVDRVGSWYLTALYRMHRLLVLDGHDDEAKRVESERQSLIDRGLKSPEERDLSIGNLGKIAAPPNLTGPGPTLAALPKFGNSELLVAELARAHLAAVDANNDGRTDLFGWGAQGLVLALAPKEAGAPWDVRKLSSEPASFARMLDLVNDPSRDLLDVVWADAQGNLNWILGAREAAPNDAKVSWSAAAIAMPKIGTESAHTVRDLEPVDFDHEGDLDLAVVGDFGVRLLRNDGAAKKGGAFTDCTAEAGLPKDRPFEWCVIEDFDTDQDVDLLFGGAQGVYLASNLRAGKFEDQTARLGAFKPRAKPVVADLDHDGRPDLFDPAHASDLWLGQPSAQFKQSASELASYSKTDARASVVDLDLDGFFDVALARGGYGSAPLEVELARAPGWKHAQPAIEPLIGVELDAFDYLIDDLDGDLKPDLVVSTARGVEIRRGLDGFGNVVRLGFRGRKDNRRAIGAVVELRAGMRYQRLFWRGDTQLVGVGSATALDWRRILWPNGILQWARSVALGDQAQRKGPLENFDMDQPDKLGASCPFLYTFNGTHFDYITDVLGITPLGLPMEPGMMVPPDHDEYVLVKGEHLKPKDGMFELAFTEELREVTYLDRVRLDVVDHPAGTEIFPNERFSFPPFPEPHIHTLRDPLSPTKATGSDGKDWTQALAKDDGDFSAPFTPVDEQLIGLASPHFLELEFDAARTKDAKKLRLFLNGWFWWTDASVNMASARDPETKFIPPILQVPDGNGGWRDAGPPIGFPAGKTKTMVVDVTSMLDHADPRLRIFTSLRLYWDSIRLAVDDDDAPLEVAQLEPSSAKLWRRGFSAPQASEKPNQPELFEWDRLVDYPRWNAHPGLYTKYGECAQLVRSIDDQFVILASGDALNLRFDATQLAPPKPGMVRDYLVFLDGWAKDRDANTLEALHVEPLPFHGMSGYPYGPGEHFPDDDAHRKWRAEWLTRSPAPWVDSLGADTRQLKPSNAAIAPRN